MAVMNLSIQPVEKKSFFQSSSAEIHRSCGFALVVALGLMSFILLLLLSITTFVRVESQVADSALRGLLARQNAKLGAMIAIGELQKTAGPDMRITAPAGILRATRDEELSNGYWTGVWDSNGELLSWLVSGNSGVDIDDDGFIHPNDWADSGLQMVADASGRVDAPRVAIDERSGFSYWIGDEGVKAKLQTTASRQPVADHTLPRRNAIELIEGLEWIDREWAQGAKITSLKELGFSPDALEHEIVTKFHDLTGHSLGLLTNVREGGLKEDLTIALFDTDALTGPIFPPVLSATPTDRDPGGPLWQQLRSWARRDLNASGDLPVIHPTNQQAGFYPVVAGVQVYFLPNNDVVNGTINMHFMPAVVLWNPYDRPLEMSNYRLEIGRAGVNANGPSGWGFNFEGLYTTSWLRSYDANTGNLIEQTRFSTDIRNRLVFDMQNVDLGAGEAKVFSPPGGSHVEMDTNLTPPWNSNPLVAGYRPEWSFYNSIRDSFTDGSDQVITDIEYDYDGGNTIIYGFRLSKLEGSFLRPLSEACFIAMVFHAPVPRTSMLTFNEEDFLSESDRNTHATGQKSIRVYVDNDHYANSTFPVESIRWLANQNPRAFHSGMNPPTFLRPAAQYRRSTINNPSFIGSYQNDGSEQSIGMDSFTDPLVGVGLRESGVITNTKLFEAPPGRARLASIAQLMHAPLYNWGPTFTLENRLRVGRSDNLIPTYTVGNSLSDPRIPLDTTFVNWDNFSSASGNLWCSL